MVAVVVVGVICAKRNKTADDFYLGGRKLNPLVAAMSAEASDMSSWLLMGCLLYTSNVMVDIPWPGLLAGLCGITVEEFEAFPAHAWNLSLIHI